MAVVVQPRLELVVGLDSWWLRPPPGEPLDLSRFGSKKAEALERLLQQRWALSSVLQKRIVAHEKHRSTSGLCCQMVVGIILPAGLLTQGGWDYDRDMAVLAKEAAAVLPAFLPPSEYELLEHIDSEAEFRDGKVLFYLYLS